MQSNWLSRLFYAVAVVILLLGISCPFIQNANAASGVTVTNEDGESEQISLSTARSLVKLHPIPNLQIMSENSVLPLTITNDSDFDIDLEVRIASSSPKLDITTSDEFKKVHLLAKSEEKTTVSLEARANGDADLTIYLVDDNAVTISKQKVDVHIFATVGLVLKIAFFGFIALMFMFGVYRTFRKHHTV